MQFSRDLIERALKSFVQAFIATFVLTLVVPGDVTDIGAWKAAAVAAAAGAVTAGLSAVSSLLSKNRGPDKGSASLTV